MIFDGRAFARKIEEGLPKVKAKLVAIVDPANEAGMKYCHIKSETAKRLNVEFLITKFEILNNSQYQKLKIQINQWNEDSEVDGIIIQLPFPNSEELINLIDPKKDVDGLREDSPYMPAAVRAVSEILNSNFETRNNTKIQNPNIVVVGARGFVGRKLMKVFPGAMGMDKDDFDPEKLKAADVVISCTGQAGLIKPEMVKPGVVCIDLGYPLGDFDPSTGLRAGFFTPVPGGVGPVTVAMLFKNLTDAVKSDDGIGRTGNN